MRGNCSHVDSKTLRVLDIAMADVEEDDGEGSDSGVARMGSKPLALLCIYSFCLQFTPSEPYLVPYLTKVKHFSTDEVTTKVFPVSVYGSLLFTLLAMPACSLFTYRSVILIGTFGRLATFGILLLGKSLLSMQMMQATYALGVASDLVFSSYLFLLVKEDMFQSLTSFTQAASTFAFLIAAELSQLLVFEGLPLITLLFISTVMVGAASVASLFLPRDKPRSIAYDLPGFRKTSGLEPGKSLFENLLSACQDLWKLAKATWDNRSLQLLSLWWAFQLGGSAMVENYGTNLFDAVDSTSIYNGHVIAATQGASCLAALVAVPMSTFAVKAGGLLYVGGSGLSWLLCIIMASSKTLWTVYLAYVLCIAVNRLLVCILYVQCAQVLSHGHYVFLFSLNGVATLLMQCFLQGFIEILGVNIFSQFYFIGNYFLLLTIAFSLLSLLYFLGMGTLRLVPAKEFLLH